jgi:hypothetical protein
MKFPSAVAGDLSRSAALRRHIPGVRIARAGGADVPHVAPQEQTGRAGFEMQLGPRRASAQDEVISSCSIQKSTAKGAATRIITVRKKKTSAAELSR